MLPISDQPLLAREPHRSLFCLYLKKIGLLRLWEAVLEQNRSGNLPYHNNEHLFGVAHICRDLAIATDLGFNSVEVKVVIAAALVHDVCHAGSGKANDSKNIENAIRWLEQYITGVEDEAEMNFFGVFSVRICELIRVTEFPFTREPVNLLEMIIRDADLLWSYQREAVRIVNMNLYKEMLAGGTIKPDYDAWVKRNIDFYRNTKWYTSGAKEVADTNIEALCKAISIKPKGN